MSLFLRSDPVPDFAVEGFVLDGELYEAAPPLRFKFERRDGGVWIEGPFDIVHWGEDLYTIIAEDIPEMLVTLWEEYALESDTNLTGKAVRLKREMRQRFGRPESTHVTCTSTGEQSWTVPGTLAQTITSAYNH